MKELHELFTEHKARLTKLNEKYKEYFLKKIVDDKSMSVLGLLFKGVGWVNRQQTELMDKITQALEADLTSEEKKYRAVAGNCLGILSRVGCF